jgi:hypothetical protein
VIKEKQRNTNIGVGLGLVLSFAATGLRANAQANESAAWYVFAGLLGLAGAVLFVWGCVNYAQGKGYSGFVGMVGLLWCIGLVILVVLPDRHKDGGPPPTPQPPPDAYPPPPGTGSNGRGPG